VEGYNLEEGTPVNGVYSIGSPLRSLLYQFAFIQAEPLQYFFVRRYKFKVEMYSNEGVTFLEISKALAGLRYALFYGLVYWQAFYSDEFNRIIDALTYLRFDQGYLVCDKCGGYYVLQPGESPDDFSVCQCGGKLEYHLFPNEPEQKEPPKPKLLLEKIVFTLFVVGIVVIYFINPIIFGYRSWLGTYLILLMSWAVVLLAIYTSSGVIRYILKINS